MKNEDQQIKDLFNDKLGELKVPCSNSVWQGIQSQIGGSVGAASSSGGFVWGTLSKIVVAVMTVATVGTGIYLLTESSNIPALREESKELTVSKISPESVEVTTNQAVELVEEQQDPPFSSAKDKDSTHYINSDNVDEVDFGDYSMDRATETDRWEVVNPIASAKSDFSENTQPEIATPQDAEQIQTLSADFSTMRYKENSMRFHFDATTSNIALYEWYIDGFVSGSNSRLEYEFEEPGKYLVQLKVIGENGASITQSTEVEAFHPPKVKVPNIFTPNGDAFNPYFDLEALSTNITVIQVQIFDMNKRLVFEQSKNRKKWDGTDRFGNLCEPGNYLCVYQALGVDQKTYKGKKIVTLRR